MVNAFKSAEREERQEPAAASLPRRTRLCSMGPILSSGSSSNHPSDEEEGESFTEDVESFIIMDLVVTKAPSQTSGVAPPTTKTIP